MDRDHVPPPPAPPMLVGVQVPEVERPVSYREVREVAKVAEEVGFDSVWVGDHLLFRDDIHGSRGPWEAWSLLAALGEATERVLLGPLVAATAFHNPAVLAKKAATVDEISGGRLVLGLGAGWNPTEFEAYGFPYDRRVDRFAEAFTIIRTLLRDGHIDHIGEFHTLRDMELVPGARPDLPLLIGSNGPRMLAIALPHVDLWNTWYVSYDNDPSRLAELVDFVDEQCIRAGRPPATVGKTAAVYVQLPGGEGRLPGDPEKQSDPITGPPAAIAERLTAFGAAGVEHLQLVVDPITPSAVAHLGEVLALLGHGR